MNPLEPLRTRLVAWLVAAAYPLWSRSGIDAHNHGFIEALDRDGQPLAQPRRARVQPRQVYAFAPARKFGWHGDATGIVTRGMRYFTTHYRRSDGLFRTLADAAGAPLDERALLYDQAFALLGYAVAARALDARREFEAPALELRRAIEVQLGADEGSYLSDRQATERRESNPHMHLLEAYLAWAEIGRDAGWARGVRSLVELALSRFIRKNSGAVGESFLATWQPTPGIAGRLVEPGHQFEWAWLLLRCERWHSGALRPTALRLISIGEEFGVRNGIAINALREDFSVEDANARCWPQCERLKAALLAAALTREPQYQSMAVSAATSLATYLNTSTPGLWLDVRLSNGDFLDAPVPASTFYHIVGAIEALDDATHARA